MSIWDDTPETAPKIQSTLPSKDAAKRAMRSSKEYQNAREQYRSRAKAHHNPDGTKGEKCWLCGEPVDYRLRFPHSTILVVRSCGTDRRQSGLDAQRQ